MKKQPRNHGKEWTSADKQQLKTLAAMNIPTPSIAEFIGRTEDSARKQASKQGTSLEPRDK